MALVMLPNARKLKMDLKNNLNFELGFTLSSQMHNLDFESDMLDSDLMSIDVDSLLRDDNSKQPSKGLQETVVLFN